MSDSAAQPLALIVPRENVNDDSVTVLAWLADEGAAIVPNQLVVRIETGKATVDLEAPGSGTLRRLFAEGADVAIGEVLAWVDPPGYSLPPTPMTPPAAMNGDSRIRSLPSKPIAPAVVQTESARPVAGLRLSRKAREQLERSGISPESLANRGLIRVRDLTAPPAPDPSPPAGAMVAPKTTGKREAPTPETPHRFEPLTRSKLFEARVLEGGTSSALTSVVTVSCPTRGLKAAARGSGSLGDSAALIIAETARLLRKYPVFNAFRHENRIGYYEEVNIGYAIDGGMGLKVPVIRGADGLTPGEIADRIRELVENYVADALPPSAMAGGTFTVTDLSGEGVFGFHPLISQGQAAILGIGGEFLPPGGGPGLFNLILAFDHRLTEGRAAARFLNDLRQRIMGYEAALSPDAAPMAATVDADPNCDRCSRSLAQLKAADGFLVRSVWPDGLVCSVCLSGM